MNDEPTPDDALTELDARTAAELEYRAAFWAMMAALERLERAGEAVMAERANIN